MMNFPDWAPHILVKLYEHYSGRRGYPDSEYPVKVFDPELHIAQLLKEDEKFKQMSPQRLKNYHNSLYQSEFGLPEKEGTEILGQLLTDLRMPPVWASLARRVKSEGDLRYFWNACESAILGWRAAQKLTPNQQRDYFLKIVEHASELSQMMNETAEFQDYSTIELIDSDLFEELLQSLHDQTEDIKGKQAIEALSRYILADGGPSIHHVLDDIAAKALRFSEEPAIVPKPNSDKAAIQYFVRTLSRYLKEEYGQPLHEVVAGTAGVVFDDPNIDSDYVRKLVG